MAKEIKNLVDEGISPDCSLCIDAPLVVQLADIYLNRAIGYYLGQQGVYVIPNIRWGDERTYATEIFKEAPAFLGVDKRSIVSIGTYGQIKSAESKKYFREGLKAMLDNLAPCMVLVYGSMPDSIFSEFYGQTEFIRYDDWTTRQHGSHDDEINIS